MGKRLSFVTEDTESDPEVTEQYGGFDSVNSVSSLCELCGSIPPPMPDSEADLIEKAKRYLKQSYGEDTVSMTVTQNAVTAGTGALGVDCTVSVGGRRSDWSKVFHFTNGSITNMDYRRR